MRDPRQNSTILMGKNMIHPEIVGYTIFRQTHTHPHTYIYIYIQLSWFMTPITMVYGRDISILNGVYKPTCN